MTRIFSYSTESIIQVAARLRKGYSDEHKVAAGYIRALEDFGIWKDGVQTIGCLNNSVKEIVAEIKRENSHEMEWEE